MLFCTIFFYISFLIKEVSCYTQVINFIALALIVLMEWNKWQVLDCQHLFEYWED